MLVYHFWKWCVIPFIGVVGCCYPSLLRTLCGMANMKQSWYNTLHLPFQKCQSTLLISLWSSFCFLILYKYEIKKIMARFLSNSASSKNPEGEVFILLCLKTQLLFYGLVKYGDACNTDRRKISNEKRHFISFIYLHIYCTPRMCGFSISWCGQQALDFFDLQ